MAQASDLQQHAATLESLAPDELARIMTFLKIKDLKNLNATSKSLHSHLYDERVWFAMCSVTFSHCTDIRQWLRTDKSSEKTPFSPLPPLYSPPPVRSPPTCFKELFFYLKKIEKLQGLWRIIGDGPVGSLISFQWTSDALEGEEISFSSLKRNPDRTPFLKLCPRRGLNVELEWGDTSDDDDDDATVQTVTLKVHPVGGTDRHLYRSSSADAAAAVSFSYGCSPQSKSSSLLLGTSPEGSFEYNWLEFMSANVAKPSKMRRRSSRGAGGGPSTAPVLYHLRRVDHPLPSTRRHPLAGMWIGDYHHTIGGVMQVLQLSYDFKGHAARVVAHKITGDEGVGAGQRSWWALAAALPQPWSAEEIELVAVLQRQQEEAAEEGALDGLEALFLEEDDVEGGDEGTGSGSYAEEDRIESGGNDISTNTNSRSRNEIVSIHTGAGQIGGGGGGYNSQEWVEGRLWVLGDGSMQWWWLSDGDGDGDEVVVMESVAMRRVDLGIFGGKYSNNDAGEDGAQKRRQQW